MKKPLVILGSIIVILFIVGFTIDRMLMLTVSPKNMAIDQINVTNQTIDFKGIFAANGVRYRGYDVNYRDWALYFKMKASYISFSKDPGIRVSIDNDFGEVTKIYLQDRSEKEDRLIWSKDQ